MIRNACLLAVAVAGWARGAPVGAQPAAEAEDPAVAEARDRFDRGVTYTSEGNYGAALAEFLRAYDLTGHWAVLYNLGRVSEALGREPDAASYFEQYLDEGGDMVEENRRAEVESALAALRTRLSVLRIDVDVPGAELLLDGAVIGTAPIRGALYVRPGPHTVTARHPDHGMIRQEVLLASEVEEHVVLALVASVGPPGEPQTSTQPDNDSVGIAGKWWFWTLIGTVVAGGAVAAGVLLAEPGVSYTTGSADPWILP